MVLSLRFVVISICLWMGLAQTSFAVPGENGAPDIVPELNEIAYQDITSRLTAYGDDLMGDSVDPLTGLLSGKRSFQCRHHVASAENFNGDSKVSLLIIVKTAK